MHAPELILSAREFVRETLPTDATGHDWRHVFRVTRNAMAIAAAEGADPLVVELAGLLHDIADHKFHGGDETIGARTAGDWLTKQGAPSELVGEVSRIVERLSYRGAGVAELSLSLAGQCVQDADRLDALGAIGIARAIAYGGHKGRAIFDPERPPRLHDSFEAYKKDAGPSINHFFEKLLLLKDRMNTATGRRMAEERHTTLVRYLETFFDEWLGDEASPEVVATWTTWTQPHGVRLPEVGRG